MTLLNLLCLILRFTDTSEQWDLCKHEPLLNVLNDFLQTSGVAEDEDDEVFKNRRKPSRQDQSDDFQFPDEVCNASR